MPLSLDDLNNYLGSIEDRPANLPLRTAKARKTNLDDLQTALFQARRSGDTNWEKALTPEVASVEADTANDPFTGDAAAARTQKVQDQLDYASPQAMTQRSRQEQEAAKQAQDIAHSAAYGKSTGESAAGVEPNAQFLRGQQEAAVVRENEAKKGTLVPDASGGGSGPAGAAPTKLNIQEQALTDAAHSMSALGEPLLQKYAQKYPGIDKNPQQYGSATDALTEKFGKGWYSFGGMTQDDPLFQDTAAIQAWGMRALAQGRINKSMMDIINAHLPQPGYSPGANYDRLQRLLHEVLPAQLTGIQQAHGDTALTLPGAGPTPPPGFKLD